MEKVHKPVDREKIVCPDCKGEGFVNNQVCDECHGSGEIKPKSFKN